MTTFRKSAALRSKRRYIGAVAGLAVLASPTSAFLSPSGCMGAASLTGRSQHSDLSTYAARSRCQTARRLWGSAYRERMTKMAAETDAGVEDLGGLSSTDTVLLKPPDRLEGMEAMGGMVDVGPDGEDAAEAGGFSAGPLFPTLPEPPFLFKIAGEFGNPNVCTDPGWGTVLLTLHYLGIPYITTAFDEDDERTAGALVCDDEYYDEPDDYLAIVPERYVLSDLVATADNIQRGVDAVRPAFEAFLANKGAEQEAKVTKDLMNALGKVEFRLSRSRGEFIESDEVTLGDMHLAVSLYHMALALRHYRKWEVPVTFVEVKRYMAMMHDMGIFKASMPPADAIVKRYAAIAK